MACPQTNPCSCIATPTIKVSTCPAGDCLFIPPILVKSSDSVAPCGNSGTASWPSCVNIPCSTNVTFTLVEQDNDNATITTINSGGFNFTITGSLTTATEFLYFAKCATENLATYFKITIVPQNLCANVLCATGFSCDTCTGDCIADGPDLEID